MRNRWKFPLFIFVALIAGVLFAGTFTHITYPCQPHPDDPTSYCVSLNQAVMHPIDLASNYQDSLTRFLLNFLVVFAIVLVPLVVINTVWDWTQKRKRHLTK